MPARNAPIFPALNLRLAKARAKVLAREDRQMKAELIRLRQRSGLSQAHVAEMLGISQQAVNKLERYDSDPKLSTLRRYANAVGALVEHHVVADVGQSEWMATASRWESVVELPGSVLRPIPIADSARGSKWSGSSRTAMRLVS